MSLLVEDLDRDIVSYIENPNDFRNLLVVNKYFKELVFDDDFFKEWKLLKSKRMSSIFVSNFLRACELGCFKICKYLYHKETSCINDGINDSEAFTLACTNGNMSLIRWIFQLKGGISASTLFQIFIRACCDGNVELAKFIYQLTVDLNIKKDTVSFLFGISCKDGGFELAKWLHQTYKELDIHVNNDFAFKWSFKKGHTYITEWLFELNKEYFYRSSNKEIAEILKTILNE